MEAWIEEFVSDAAEPHPPVDLKNKKVERCVAD